MGAGQTLHVDFTPTDTVNYNTASKNVTINVTSATTAQIAITMSPALQKVAIGGKATFTIKVTNTGSVKLTNVIVTDALASNCNKTFSSLNAGASQTYTCTKTVTADMTNVVVVTAKPPTGPNVTANASAVVDVLPKISVTKSANPTQVLFTGGSVTFTFVVNNQSTEPVTIATLSDSVFGPLTGSVTCQVGTMLQPNASCAFTLTRTISGAPGTTHLNIFTATAVDNENNSASATDDAKVYFFWNGRKASYWKDHTSVWPEFTVIGSSSSSVTIRTSTLVRSVFTVPGSSTCIKSTDTLLKALGYSSGSSVCSATQTLIREAVAAILNKKYYGNTYPNYNSSQKIITAVNAAIATNNSATIINLANQLDYWNNGSN